MAKKTDEFKKTLIYVFVASLIISALIGIIIFIIGDFGELQRKILGTTAIIGGSSLIALISYILYEKKKLIPLSQGGIVVSIIGGIVWILGLWDIIDNEWIWKTLLTGLISISALIIISLLMLIKMDKNPKVFMSMMFTFGSVITLALMLITLVFAEDVSNLFVRIIGVLSITSVLGIIVTPIFARLK